MVFAIITKLGSGEDREAAEFTRKHFPNAYIPNQEMLTLKEKVKNFKGGTIVMIASTTATPLSAISLWASMPNGLKQHYPKEPCQK